MNMGEFGGQANATVDSGEPEGKETNIKLGIRSSTETQPKNPSSRPSRQNAGILSSAITTQREAPGSVNGPEPQTSEDESATETEEGTAPPAATEHGREPVRPREHETLERFLNCGSPDLEQQLEERVATPLSREFFMRDSRSILTPEQKEQREAALLRINKEGAEKFRLKKKEEFDAEASITRQKAEAKVWNFVDSRGNQNPLHKWRNDRASRVTAALSPIFEKNAENNITIPTIDDTYYHRLILKFDCANFADDVDARGYENFKTLMTDAQKKINDNMAIPSEPEEEHTPFNYLPEDLLDDEPIVSGTITHKARYFRVDFDVQTEQSFRVEPSSSLACQIVFTGLAKLGEDASPSARKHGKMMDKSAQNGAMTSIQSDVSGLGWLALESLYLRSYPTGINHVEKMKEQRKKWGLDPPRL